MGDEHLFEGDAPTRSVGPTLGDVTGADPNAPPLLGTGDIFGPYRVIRMLGRGGMGEVYEVEDRENARRVALKVLSNRLSGPADRARFIREGRLAAGISHPNTIYVYGTDDINGVPVIAMELAPGGTLKDRVKIKGVLPPSQAVDAVLQVIAGLEAAADAGVLHRDIKPSNCFVDSDGTVKVGDFGLSVSTQTFDERSLTMLGTVLGTPGFSSPEQLRGDDLDVRSDIYSVGATLYYLLTGKAPFDDPNVIKLVTQVAHEIPQSPRIARPEVPADLADAVMRCLAKKPAERFESYASLRDALEPFSSNAPAPAPLGLRLGAGVVDNLLLTLLAMPVASFWWQGFTPTNPEGMIKGTIAGWVVQLAYYTVSEGVWGRSLGKQLFGLRVVDLLNHRPGIPRGFMRTVAWILGDGLPLLLYGAWILGVVPNYQDTPAGALLGLSMPLMTFAILGVLFSTARRRNGYAAMHDLVSGTRVVLKRRGQDRLRSASATTAVTPVSTRERIGPYVRLDERPLGIPDLVSAYDDRLRRRVWIQMREPSDAPVSQVRRAIARPGRLRWLAGRRSEAESWDAFESPEGVSLLKAVETPRSWAEVRYWLLDLATEIRACQSDAVPVTLSADRVWITPAGRARLLDWGPPAAQPTTPQTFLRDVASRAATAAMPLHARTFLARLEQNGFESMDAVVKEASTLVDQPASLTSGRRVSHLLISLLPMLFMGVITLFTATVLIWTQSAPGDTSDLVESLVRITRLRGTKDAPPGEQRAFEIYVASHYRDLIRNEATWTEGMSMLRFNRALRTVATDALARHPSPSADEVAASAKVVEPFLAREREKAAREISPRGLLSLVMVFAAGMTVVFAIPGLLSALFFRGGLVLRLLGIAIVTSSGEAGRVRAFVRGVIAWSPAALAVIALLIRPPGIGGVVWLVLAAAALVLLAVGAIYAMRNPSRGLQDRLAGTWLVPR